MSGPALPSSQSILANPQRAFAEADALEQTGRYAEAENIYRVLLSRFGNQPVLFHSLALVRKAQGDFAEAETLMRRAIATAPNEPAFHNNFANLLRQKGEPAQAVASYARALALKPDYPEAHYNMGVTLGEMGDIPRAIESLRQAVSLNPSYMQARTRIAALLGEQGFTEDAIRELEPALAQSPDYFEANYYYGLYLSMQDRDSEAETAMKRAVSINPGSAQALTVLAGIANRRSNTAAARDYAERALEIDRGHVGATIALARADVAERKFHAAKDRLGPLLDQGELNNDDIAIVNGLLADALDGLGDAAKAFEAYTTENETLRDIYANRFAAGASIESARRIGAFVAASKSSDWNTSHVAQTSDRTPRMHVFLMGFLRSGTTLLEQALAAHPDVAALEERDLLRSTADEFLATEHGLKQLTELADEDFAPYREAYWERVRLEGVDPAGKVFVDKLPLNTMSLPLLAKLFPHAKVLFALRDPRDVVLSCFRRHFDVNVATFEMLTLEGTAHLYDAAMAIAEASSDKLPLATHCIRHEDLVQAFEKEVRAVCDFIGIDWRPEMLDFGARAKDLPLRSLSAAQIRKGLNRDGVGQWKRYAENLAPVQPILAPWVKKFGYTDTAGASE
jgi:tetratricopeptide (TPR) repeat protein